MNIIMMTLFLFIFAFKIILGHFENLENTSRPPGLNQPKKNLTVANIDLYFSLTSPAAPIVPTGYKLQASYSIPGMNELSVTPNIMYYAEVCGAQGSNNCNNNYGVSYGGLGGCMYSFFSPPSAKVVVVVGGQGICPTGGSNGGGRGRCNDETVGQFGGGGGGASDIRTDSQSNSRVVVGGGGGGAGYDSCTGLTGGQGGGLVAGSGSYGQTWVVPIPGQGGTQVAGGAGGIYGGYSQGSPGDLVQGGDSGLLTCGGGGGGGYYGGGGGSWTGGGGGSSYSKGAIVGNLMGVNPGDGIVKIYSPSPSMSPTMEPTQPSNQPTTTTPTILPTLIPTKPTVAPTSTASTLRPSASGGSDNFLTIFFAIFGSIVGCLFFLVFGYTFVMKRRRVRADESTDTVAKTEMNNQQQQYFHLPHSQPQQVEMNNQQQMIYLQPQPQPSEMINNQQQMFYLQQPQPQEINYQQQQQQFYVLQQPHPLEMNNQQQQFYLLQQQPAQGVIPVTSKITVVQERQPLTAQFGYTVPSAPPMVVEDVPSMVAYPAVSNPSNEPHSIELQNYYANTNNTYNNNNHNSSARPADRSTLTNCDFVIERY